MVYEQSRGDEAALNLSQMMICTLFVPLKIVQVPGREISMFWHSQIVYQFCSNFLSLYIQLLQIMQARKINSIERPMQPITRNSINYFSCFKDSQSLSIMVLYVTFLPDCKQKWVLLGLFQFNIFNQEGTKFASCEINRHRLDI